jgi:hypothetical protein
MAFKSLNDEKFKIKLFSPLRNSGLLFCVSIYRKAMNVKNDIPLE